MHVLSVFLFGLVVLAQGASPTVAQEKWLKAFEGNLALEGPSGSGEVGVVISREKDLLVLESTIGTMKRRASYDLSGSDHSPFNAVLRTRLEGQRIITQIWDGKVASGAPSRIETRYMESQTRMVTELRRSAGESPFQVSVLLRRK